MTWALTVLFAACPIVYAQVVQWKVSNDRDDVSCNEVCRSSGRVCSEKCWPKSPEELNRAAKAQFDGFCFLIEGASPMQSLSSKAWNPAKDPSTKVCYWESDASTESRCGVVPYTPSHMRAEGQFVRRLCPCGIENRTTAADCFPEAPVAAQDVPLGSDEDPLLPVVEPEGDLCSALCVDGFEDALWDFNGEYLRAGGSSSGAYWEHSKSDRGVAFLRGGDGHWRLFGAAAAAAAFETNSTSGVANAIATSTEASEYGTEVPPDSSFETSAGFHNIRFRCCPRWDTPVAPRSDTATRDEGAAIVVLVFLGFFGFMFAVIAGVLWFRKRRRVGSYVHDSLSEDGTPSKSQTVRSNKSIEGKSDRADTTMDLEAQSKSTQGFNAGPHRAIKLCDTGCDSSGIQPLEGCFSWTCNICGMHGNAPGDSHCKTCGRERGKQPKRSHSTVDELLKSVVHTLEGQNTNGATARGGQSPSRNSRKDAKWTAREGSSNWDGSVSAPGEQFPPRRGSVQVWRQPSSQNNSRPQSRDGGTPQKQQQLQQLQLQNHERPLQLQDQPQENANTLLRRAASSGAMEKANEDRSCRAIAEALGQRTPPGSASSSSAGRGTRNRGPPPPEVGSRVVLCNMHSKPTWNDAEGIVEDYDAENDRCYVLLDDGVEMAVKPNQCRVKKERGQGVDQDMAPLHPHGRCREGACFYSEARGAWSLCGSCEARLSPSVAIGGKATPRGGRFSNRDTTMLPAPRPNTPPGQRDPSRERGRPRISACNETSRGWPSAATPSPSAGAVSGRQRKFSADATGERFSKALADFPAPPLPAPPQKLPTPARRDSGDAGRRRASSDTAAPPRLIHKAPTSKDARVAQKQAALNSSLERLQAQLGPHSAGVV